MKFISVTRTGNECDIIEPFVRHHAELFNRLLIIDDSSTDGTAIILDKLKAEGLPLDIYKASEVDWAQPDFVLQLLRRAFTDHAADWVALLDADEFVELPLTLTLAKLLPQTSDYLLHLRWSNFLWLREFAVAQGNPIEFMRKRLPPRFDSAKLMIPRNLYEADPELTVAPGNHGILSRGQRLLFFYYGEIELCHFPIRSIDQFTSKCVINYLRYLEAPPGFDRIGFQYHEPVEVIKSDQTHLLATMERASLNYAPLTESRKVGEFELRPLAYRGGPLRYSEYQTRSLANIIRYAESLARTIAALSASAN